MFLLLWMWSALRVVVARVRNSVACVSAAYVSEPLPKHMFWHLPPAPVLIGRVNRRLLTSTDKWPEKNKIFDERERWMVETCPDESGGKEYWRNFLEVLLDQVCKEWTRLGLAFSHKHGIVLRPSRSWTKLADGRERKEDEHQIGARFGACMWIYAKAATSPRSKGMEISVSQTHSITEATNETWGFLCGTHEWIQKSSVELQEGKIM